MSTIETNFIELIKTGNLEEIQQFYYNNDTINISVYQDRAFETACNYGHVHVAKWLLSIKPNINFLQFIKSVFKEACLGEPLIDIAKWLISIEPTANVDKFRKYVDYKKLFKYACKHNFELAQFLFDTKTEVHEYARDERHFLAAIKNNHHDIASWLASIQRPTNTSDNECNDLVNMFKKIIFIGLIKKGNLMEVQNFYSVNTSINISVNNEEPFRTACEYGYLHIAEWLLQTKNDIDVSVCSKDTFKIVCAKGYLEIAKFLLNIVPNLKSTIGYSLLEDVCDQANTDKLRVVQEMIQFLFSIDSDMFIQAINSDLITVACIRNLWNIVKWLVSIKPSVITEVKEDKYKFAYNHACKHQQLEIAELLKPTDIVVN
jgi:ankyrin repeat protein